MRPKAIRKFADVGFHVYCRDTPTQPTALAEIQMLRGINPICAHCKKIRDDRGAWSEEEEDVRQHSDAMVSHGICPACVVEVYPAYADDPP